MRNWKVPLLLIVAVLGWAKEKKPTGQITNRAAFLRIESYCVETSDMASDEAYVVKGFVEQEKKPRKLLTRLPWRLLHDCSTDNPDVALKVKFPYLKVIEVTPGLPRREDQDARDTARIKAVLELRDSSSSALIYEVEASPLDNPSPEAPMMTSEPLNTKRYNALYNAVGNLIEDIRRVTPR